LRFLLTLSLFVFASFAGADTPIATVELRKHLNDEIKFISPNEIRYCPDDTCEIFRGNAQGASEVLPVFVFLYLFHESSYIYLAEPVGKSEPFRKKVKLVEQKIRRQAESYCSGKIKNAKCILKTMKNKFGIIVTFGRYDEGEFNET
jgi:hypothetical protein